MFLVMSVHHSVRGVAHLTITYDALDLTIQEEPPWFQPLLPKTWVLTIQEPQSHPPTPQLVHYDVCTVAVRILLECFLVSIIGWLPL